MTYLANAREELLKHVKSHDVEYVKIRYRDDLIEGTLENVVDRLDFDYDADYGEQNLFGYIWYKDGTWSERWEYDGSEGWRHITRPSQDVEVINEF